MKKAIALILALVMVFALVACGGSKPAEAPKAEEPKTEAPKAEEPKAEEPKAEEPKAEEPKAEEPAAKPQTYDELLAAAKAAGKEYKIGYLCKRMTVQWMQDMDAAFQKLSKEWGFKYELYDAQGDIETQMNQLDTMLDQGFDGIVTIIADQGMSQAVVDKALEKGVPIIGESLKLIDDDGKIVGTTVELSSKLCGELCANWIYENYANIGFADIANDWSKVGFIGITNSTQPNALERSDGAWDAWKANVPDFPDANHFVADVAADPGAGYVDQAYNQVNARLAASPEIEYWLIVAILEDFGQGAIRAIEDNGKADKTILTSIGGECAKLEWAAREENGTLDTCCWYACAYYEAMDCARVCIQGLYDYLINGTPYNELFPEWRVEGDNFSAAKFAGNMVTPANYKDFMTLD